MQQPTFSVHQHRPLFASLAIFTLITAMVLCQLFARDILQGIYVVLALLVVFSTFILLLRPRAILCAALVYLASPVPMMLSPAYSGLITGMLVINCVIGTLLTAGPRVFLLPFKSLRTPLFIGAASILAVAYGLSRANSPAYVFGDLYQIFEFGAVFLLTTALVTSEEQWRSIVNLLLGCIIFASVLQLADAAMGADYLPRLEQFGVSLPRTINLNAPIACCAIFALLPNAKKQQKFLLACVGILAVNLVMGFTRGLWLAAFLSLVFLLFLQRGKERRTTLKLVFVSTLIFVAGLSIFTLGSAKFLKIIQERVAYSVTQYESASGNEEVLSARRLIEYVLIGSQIPEHPILGKGLGATYEISGAAVIEGPADEKVDYHYIHNLYLLIAFRLGIPALLAFLVLLWKYFRNSIRIYRSGSLSPGNSALMAGLIASMFGEVALSMTSPTFLNHPTAGILACIMALTLVVPRLSSPAPA